MKLYLYCSLFALLFLVSCRSDKVYSEWSLQNRESGEYLGEKQGSFCFAAEPSGDEYLWIIEGTSGEEFLIKNKKSGNYLQLDGEGAVCAAPGGQETENMKWKYGGFDFVTQKNCGWDTLEKADGKKIFVWHLNGTEDMPCGAYYNNDEKRLWPGAEGDCLPHARYADTLKKIGFEGDVCTMEVFRPDYYKLSNEENIKKAAEVTKAHVAKYWAD